MMKFSTYFSEQARRPSGFFGRMIMPVIFDRGNAFLNSFVYDVMDIKPDDQILEIGCGTGSLIKAMADSLENGFIEGIDFSSQMVMIAKKKNSRHIARGVVNISEDHFDTHSFKENSFTKACSVNTIYFWEKPERTVNKVSRLMQPGGMFVLAFEDVHQLEQRKLSRDVFRFYRRNAVRRLLENSGFSNGVHVESREKGRLRFHCTVATK
jgi:ubiquinone/menaquinone biosynthesis C-methylase UbiE